MRRPARQWEQYEGRSRAELMRGCGWWPSALAPCSLEPPFESFDHRTVTPWDCFVNGWEGGWRPPGLQGLLGLLLGRYPAVLRDGALPQALPAEPAAELAAIPVAQFPEDEVTIPKAAQFLLSLPALRYPVAFEVFGIGGSRPSTSANTQSGSASEAAPPTARPSVREPVAAVQFVAEREEARVIWSQLLAQYPNSAVTLEPAVIPEEFDESRIESWATLKRDGDGAISAADLALTGGVCFPLRTYHRLDPDPLGVAIAAMDQIPDDGWAILQVLFQQAQHPWHENIAAAIRHPFKPSEAIFGDIDSRAVDTKLDGPLFAVSIRLLASDGAVMKQLVGWAEQFACPPQHLRPTDAAVPIEPYGADVAGILTGAVCLRLAYRPGMLLSVAELSSLVHLPGESVVSERLRRVKQRTRPVPRMAAGDGSVLLGTNTHRGVTREVRVPFEQRTTHMYLTGASGVGKSTLLLRMILSDIESGHGVGVLDPDGDLIDDLVPRLPRSRLADVVYLNFADTEYPVALNIVEAQDEHERERVVAETITALSKFFSASWGHRMEHVLAYALDTAMRTPGATLWEVRRLLVDGAYRRNVLDRIADRGLLDFWNHEFPSHGALAVGPILNKLSPFLRYSIIRNIICQPRCLVDFDEVINTRKVLLVKLPFGLLSEQVATVLGTFLVTKIRSAGFRRQPLPKAQRVPFFLYIDEWQNFMDTGGGFEHILAQARRFNLILAGLANQYIGQLSDSVRKAIFGNVGTFVSFRLGTEDAPVVARQFAGFAAEELMNLERGSAICRIGPTATAFNLRTYPEPPRSDDDPGDDLVARARAQYARPRSEVERALRAGADSDQGCEVASASAGGATEGPPKQARRKRKKKLEDFLKDD
jgi:hypothetical protein